MRDYIRQFVSNNEVNFTKANQVLSKVRSQSQQPKANFDQDIHKERPAPERTPKAKKKVDDMNRPDNFATP